MSPSQQQHGQMPDHVLNWAVDVFTAVVLHVRLGFLGAPP
jgi:hypothetical protein